MVYLDAAANAYLWILIEYSENFSILIVKEPTYISVTFAGEVITAKLSELFFGPIISYNIDFIYSTNFLTNFDRAQLFPQTTF